MKNAELYHHAYEIALGAIKQKLEAKAPIDLFRSYLDHPQVNLDILGGTLTITLSLVSSSVIGLDAVYRELSKLINLDFQTLLPLALEPYVLDKNTLTVSKAQLQQTYDKQLSEYDDGDCRCDDATIIYKHSVVYKINSKKEEQLLLKMMKNNLELVKNHDTDNSRVIPKKIGNALTFTLTQAGQKYSCYLDISSKKIGFAQVTDENGQINKSSSPTWDLWSNPSFDARPIFDTHGSVEIKGILQGFLVKGVTLSKCVLYTQDYSYQKEGFSAYKLINLRANIGTYHSPFWVQISLKKTGKISFKNFLGQDVTDSPRCQLVSEKIDGIRKELFRNNQNYASMFFQLFSDFRKDTFKDWGNPFASNGVEMYFR